MASCPRKPMGELRELRRSVGLSQQDCAEVLNVSLETFRTWDSGRRPVPAAEIQRARKTLADHTRQTELLTLQELASELGVHVRTLRAAARTGRLDTSFSVRSVFGHPRRMASRAAGEKFKRTHYRCFAGQAACPAPLPVVPADYDQQLKHLRSRLKLSQQALAQRIGAAGKAVVYQWESRNRTPSPDLPPMMVHLL
jgi:DNA-binding transcriptional regulator YiaG